MIYYDVFDTLFDFSDSKVIALFELGNLQVSRAEISNLVKKKTNDPDFQDCSDTQLAMFLKWFDY